jgi:hypothetical protein
MGPTEKTSKVLRAVGVDGALLAVGLVPELVHVVVLGALEAVEEAALLDWFGRAEGRKKGLPVEQDATEALVKVLAQAGDGLLENVHGSAALLAVRLLVGEIVVQNLLDRMDVGQRNELLILGHILPVVDKQRLNMVGNWELDGGTVVEVVLLDFISMLRVRRGTKQEKSKKFWPLGSERDCE